MRDHSKHIELSREDAVKQLIKALGDDFGWSCPYEESSQAQENSSTQAAPASSANTKLQALDIKGKDTPWTKEKHAREVERKLVERVSLAQAYGRVLAHSLHSRVDVPNKLTCSMDSIAVHWSDFEDGIPSTEQWKQGIDWEFANTGIAMPEGFDTAIVVENVEFSADANHVAIKSAPSERYAGTRAIGSEMREGDLLCAAGKVLNADDIARIASGNHTSVPVVRRPRVAFIPTGNELVSPGSALSLEGKNIEANSYVVRGKVEEWGGIFVPFDIVPDKPELIEEAILRACEVADIIVLNAGSSKGSDDWSVEQMEHMGKIICHQTNHGPGHHSSYAIVENCPVVGISGPPAGCSFTLNFYLKPVIKRFLGLNFEPERIPAILTQAFPPKKPHHVSAAQKSGEAQSEGARNKEAHNGEVRPSVVAAGASFYAIKFLELHAGEDGILYATPIPGRPGSAPTLHANAYYMLGTGPGVKAPEKGDVIWVELR